MVFIIPSVYVSIFIGIISYVVVKVILWAKEFMTISNAVKDVGSLKRHPLLGHLKWVTPDEAGIYRSLEIVKKFPKCTTIWFGPFMIYLTSHHPDILKYILNSNAPKEETVYGFLKPWIGNGLLTSSGKKWKRNRRLLTPAFHFEVLKKYFESMNDSATEMIEKWSNSAKKQVAVEMFHDIGLMALDNLLRCILSKKSGCQQGGDVEYLNAVKFNTEVTMTRLHNPLFHLDLFFSLSKTGRKYKKTCKIAHDYTENAINERKTMMANGERSKADIDFLDILLLAKDENGVGLTHGEICDEVDTFVFEGHDTVTSAMSWTFYNLALHQEYQEICRKEIQKVLGQRTRIEYDDLSKFEYLTMCIKESMRIYPPVFALAKKLDEPLVCPRGFGSDQYHTEPNSEPKSDAAKVLPTNMRVGIGIIQLHRNPVLWKKPDVFDPTRFTLENISKRSPHAYIPFSSGPRNCIGQNFAMNEMKVVLASSLQKFRFKVDDSFPKPKIEPHVILRSKTGIHLILEKL